MHDSVGASNHVIAKSPLKSAFSRCVTALSLRVVDDSGRSRHCVGARQELAHASNHDVHDRIKCQHNLHHDCRDVSCELGKGFGSCAPA